MRKNEHISRIVLCDETSGTAICSGSVLLDISDAQKLTMYRGSCVAKMNHVSRIAHRDYSAGGGSVVISSATNTYEILKMIHFSETSA